MLSRQSCLNPLVPFVLLCTSVGVVPSVSSGAFENHPDVEKRFSRESGEDSYKRVAKLYEAHARVYDAFSMRSNLRTYDPGTNENPSLFLGADASKLPTDATITLSLTKEEFVALKMPDWESMVLGGQNSIAFLKAWMAYQSYENARLRLELLEMKSPEGADALRAELKSEMAAMEKEIIAYLESEPAD